MALSKTVRTHCEQLLEIPIDDYQPASGGSINTAGVLQTTKGKYFIKQNEAARYPQMFETEAKGLDELRQTKAIRIPKVIAVSQEADTTLLILEHIETGRQHRDFWIAFGTALAALHRHSHEQFGLDYDNYLGSLPQPNSQHASFIEFFVLERLQIQLRIAVDDGFFQSSTVRAFDRLYRRLPDLLPDEPPALIHGDLWSGNFMVDADDQPVLIDPAVCYAHREMDLAMSRLFGGFDREFYESYTMAFPVDAGLPERIPIYQLYYLLAHVNLFGGGYVASVQQIIQRF